VACFFHGLSLEAGDDAVANPNQMITRSAPQVDGLQHRLATVFTLISAVLGSTRPHPRHRPDTDTAIAGDSAVSRATVLGGVAASLLGDSTACCGRPPTSSGATWSRCSVTEFFIGPRGTSASKTLSSCRKTSSSPHGVGMHLRSIGRWRTARAAASHVFAAQVASVCRHRNRQIDVSDIWAATTPALSSSCQDPGPTAGLPRE
jgi:hypothetical protein